MKPNPPHLFSQISLDTLALIAATPDSYIRARWPYVEDPDGMWRTVRHEASHTLATLATGGSPGILFVHMHQGEVGSAHVVADASGFAPYADMFVDLAGVIFEKLHGDVDTARCDWARVQRYLALPDWAQAHCSKPEAEAVAQAARTLITNYEHSINALAAGYLMALPKKLHARSRTMRHWCGDKASEKKMSKVYKLVRGLVHRRLYERLYEKHLSEQVALKAVNYYE